MIDVDDKEYPLVYEPENRFLPLTRGDIILVRADQTRGPHLVSDTLGEIFAKSVDNITDEDKRNIEASLDLIADMAFGKKLKPSDRVREFAQTARGNPGKVVRAEDSDFIHVDTRGSSNYLRRFAPFFNRVVKELDLTISPECQSCIWVRPAP